MAGLYHRLLRKLAHFQTAHPFASVGILLFLTVAIYGGVSSVRTVASLEQMMPKDVTEIKAFNTLRDNHLGQDMIAAVLFVDRDSTDPKGVIDIRDRRAYEYVDHLTGLLMMQPDVIEAYSFSEVIGMHSGGELSDAEYEKLVDDPKLSPMLSNYINDDYTVTIILATTDVAADDPRMNLLSAAIKEDIESAGIPSGLRVKITGTPVIQQRLGELIEKDRNDTQWISTLLVFVITMLIFGTFTSAVVPIVIVTVSVNWLYGTMGYTGLPISTLAGGVAAMVIGIGIDFAIHIMNKFKYERKAGLSIPDSIEQAVVDTGTALTATSVTTIAAFLAFLAGQMPEMGRFGILMAIGIAYSLVFSLFGLPALIVLEEKLIYFMKAKMRFGVEGELHLAGDSESCPQGYRKIKARDILDGQELFAREHIADRILLKRESMDAQRRGGPR